MPRSLERRVAAGVAASAFVACQIQGADAARPESSPSISEVQSASVPSAVASSPWHVEAWVTGLLAEPFAARGPLSDWGYGVSLGVGARRAPIPLSFGAEIAGVHWGSLTVPVLLELGDTPTPARVSISQQTMFLDLWLRAQPPRGQVRPYLELVGGLKLIDSAYSLSFPGGNGVTSVFAEATTPASTIGLGLGVDWLLARRNGDRDSGLLITLGLRKLWGSRVSLEHPTYGVFETDTDTVLVSLGFAVKTRLGPTERP